MVENAEADSLKRVFGLNTPVIYGVGDILAPDLCSCRKIAFSGPQFDFFPGLW